MQMKLFLVGKDANRVGTYLVELAKLLGASWSHQVTKQENVTFQAENWYCECPSEKGCG